jgi:hypothetical protein
VVSAFDTVIACETSRDEKCEALNPTTSLGARSLAVYRERSLPPETVGAILRNLPDTFTPEARCAFYM